MYDVLLVSRQLVLRSTVLNSQCLTVLDFTSLTSTCPSGLVTNSSIAFSTSLVSSAVPTTHLIDLVQLSICVCTIPVPDVVVEDYSTRRSSNALSAGYSSVTINCCEVRRRPGIATVTGVCRSILDMPLSSSVIVEFIRR